MDAEIGLKAVEHLLGMFTAARLRLGRASLRCEECGSYQLAVGECRHCGWVDPSYEPPKCGTGRRRSGHSGWLNLMCPALMYRRSSGWTTSGSDCATANLASSAGKDDHGSHAAATVSTSTGG